MAAYLIAEQEVTDEALFAEFASGMFELVGTHNGRFLARGGTAELAAGDRTPHRVVIIEFESLDHVRAFVGSAEYQRLGELRDRSSNAIAIIVDGV